MKKVLLGIDIQNDFCNPKGALAVKGADSDSVNIAKFIDKYTTSLDAIIMSMDSHQPVHIAHQIYWKDEKGNHPDLFSAITYSDVESRKWMPQYNNEMAKDYLLQLEQNGGTCTIWPPHCIIGTEGWSIDGTVFEAIEKWTIATGKSYELVNKGMHQSTEHYSIFKAAVEYATIEATVLNKNLIKRLSTFDQIFIAGEAADFCVANSLKDLLEAEPTIAPKIYMLTDCMSYIVEGSSFAQEVFKKAESMGVIFCKSSEL